MDVYCTTCREPWDTYHLRHDAIWETDLPECLQEKWDGKLDPVIRAAFKRAGYHFGSSPMHVRRCPCCPADADIDAEKDVLKELIARDLGDDIDGIASTFEELGA